MQAIHFGAVQPTPSAKAPEKSEFLADFEKPSLVHLLSLWLNLFVMKFIQIIALLLLPACVLATSAATTNSFTDRTPAYFVDLYGYPTSSKNVAKVGFVQPKYGSVDVKGKFSVREFRSGDLSIRATFEVPSLRLAGVRLQLPRQWTTEQLNAALAAYASDWKPTNLNGFIGEWRKSDGSKAVYLVSSLEIQSPPIVKAVEQVISEMEAKRKVVPKF